MGFPRQEYWRGLTSSPGDLPESRITPASPALQADSSPTELPGKPVIVIVLKPKADHSIYLRTCYGLLAQSKHPQGPAEAWAGAQLTERIVLNFFFFFYFLVVPRSMWILLPRSEPEPMPLTLRACIVLTTRPSGQSQNDHI